MSKQLELRAHGLEMDFSNIQTMKRFKNPKSTWLDFVVVLSEMITYHTTAKVNSLSGTRVSLVS